MSTKVTSSSYTSSTNRFNLPGGVYAHSDAPPPGAYEPKKLDGGMAVSMMQKMVRAGHLCRRHQDIYICIYVHIYM